jgi:hypothetical protein
MVLLASRTGPLAGRLGGGQARSLGSRACSFSTCGWLWDYAGPGGNSRFRFLQCGLPVGSIQSAPGIIPFRSSIPRPSMPLSTLHPVPRGTQRKTRGQDVRYSLSCGTLSSPTTRRFIPTLALPAVAAQSSFRAATVGERSRHRPMKSVRSEELAGGCIDIDHLFRRSDGCAP